MPLSRLLIITSTSILAILLVVPTFLPPGRGATQPASEGVIGQLLQYQVQENESLIEIARKFDVGYNSIVAANRGLDPFIPRPGATVTIPIAWIPPIPGTRPAIVVNLPEYRLYFFPQEMKGSIVTFPLGIGEEGKDTPVGRYQVTEMVINPTWYVPRSIRAKRPGMPAVVKPGPGNPLGTHALRLSRNSILIHGTNRPWGIGRRSSHGCLRLYPEDIRKLFHLAQPGLHVEIMNQPLKVASRDERVFVEVHSYDGKDPTVGEAMGMLAEKHLLFKTDLSKLVQAVAEKRGVPVEVTRHTHSLD